MALNSKLFMVHKFPGVQGQNQYLFNRQAAAYLFWKAGTIADPNAIAEPHEQ